MTDDQSEKVLYLEGLVDDQRHVKRMPIVEFPFRVGRLSGLPMTLNFVNVSRLHAEFVQIGTRVVLRDLGSRNGTFVNHERITGDVFVNDNDVVHFGTCEFRILSGQNLDHTLADPGETMSTGSVNSDDIDTGARDLLRMIRDQAVRPVYQPLVNLGAGDRFGYEILGRGTLETLSSEPIELFRVAKSVNAEKDLSRLFRNKGLELAAKLPGDPYLFLNVHPTEMENANELLRGIEDIIEDNPNLRLVIEVHEGMVTEVSSMHALRGALREIGVGLAYDDFGQGQARLVELVDVPPDYLKFDKSLVRGLYSAPRNRQEMVEMLVNFARNQGVRTLAEGVETDDDATVCAQIGFDCAQGYFYGRPDSPEAFIAS